MKGAEELLEPHVELPKGLPPKRLIVWVFALFMILIVILSLLTTASEPAIKTTDEYVREVASKLNANDKLLLDKGATWVDEAYGSSGLATQIAQGLVTPTPASSSPGAEPSTLATSLLSPSPSVNTGGLQANVPWANPGQSKSAGSPLAMGEPVPSLKPMSRAQVSATSALIPSSPLSPLSASSALAALSPLSSLSPIPVNPNSNSNSNSNSLPTLSTQHAYARNNSLSSPLPGAQFEALTGQNTVDLAKEVEAINSKMMVADFDDRSGSQSSSSSVRVTPKLTELNTKALSLGENTTARLSELKDRNAELMALQAFTQKSPSSVKTLPTVERPRDTSESALLSGAQGLQGVLGLGGEELLRQAMKSEEDPSSSATLRSRDGIFLKEATSSSPLKPALRSAAIESPLAILEGSVIPAILGRDVNSDLPGVITATVAQTVYDSVHSQRALICKGSKLIGRYSNEIRGGQSRLLFAFTRLILNDGRSFNLAGFDGSDEMGGAGAQADVNNHFLKLYGASLAIGVLSDRVSKQNLSTQGVYTQPSATGQIFVQTTKEILQRNQDWAPTLSVQHGTRINVEVRRDLVFPERGLPSCA